MLKEQDKLWLNDKYPNLSLQDGRVVGSVEFAATYNMETGNFLILDGTTPNTIGGIRLEGRFDIRIEQREHKIFSKLPALFIEGINSIPDRHFNPNDKSACLCSPLEEEEFLNPEFNFVKFFRELVIPFIYGQVFYSSYNRWPWDEYAHGALGLLQSYGKQFQQIDKDAVMQFVSYLQHDKDWIRYKDLLSYPRPSKQKCPCGSGNKFRDCHNLELQALTQLKADISNFGISII